MGEHDELELLRATVADLGRRVRLLEDHLAITQLVAQYGPAVDSGSGEATAALWSDNGIFDAVGAITMRGHDEIAPMVHGDGHQGLISNGCAHVLTVPHVVVDGDVAHGRSYAMNIRWDPSSSCSGWLASRPTLGDGSAPQTGGGSWSE
jgi:SnoaL-like domain